MLGEVMTAVQSVLRRASPFPFPFPFLFLLTGLWFGRGQVTIAAR